MHGPMRKRNARNDLYSKATLAVLVVLVVLFSRGVWNVYSKAQQAKERRVQIESELAELREKEQTLGAEIERLDTKRGIEEEIREKYRLTREGEELVVIIDDEDLSDNQTATALPASRGIVKRFLDSIF